MSIALSDTQKFTISRTGLEVHDHLSFEEWSGLAPVLNEAARGVAFVIGDWLLYGDDRFGGEAAGKRGANGAASRVRPEDYEAAVGMTGLDRATLHTYAHVSRRVPSSLRDKDLSWEHHKIVAKLPPADQQRWLGLAADHHAGGRPVSTRRLRRSISAGRLLDADEVNLPENDKGIENHIPFVNRLVAWWARMKAKGWLDGATPEQRAAVKRDLEPVVKIYEAL
jgi:hypothetical protein